MTAEVRQSHVIEPYERCGSQFRAVCSCGWKSIRCGVDSADARMRSHLQIMTGRTVSE